MGFFDNKTITVYNKYTDTITESTCNLGECYLPADLPAHERARYSEKEIWLPTVITEIDYTATQGANITKSGLSTADAVTVFINYSALKKPYKSPNEWQSLTSAEKALNVTFSQGIDFFVFGDTSSVTILATGFFAYMQKHYSDCYKITTVDRYEDVMPHFEIGGK